MHTENQTWIVERGGDVVEKKARVGLAGLSDWERLVYCLWVADYMMRNAGDFANAEVMYPDFQADAARLAKGLGLGATFRTFSLSRRKLQREFLDRFGIICEEIKGAEGGQTPNAASEATPVSPLPRSARSFRRGSASGR